MQKQQKYHHSVTENNKLQLRIITRYVDDAGNVVSEKYSEPVTPANPEKMKDWDIKSQEIVSAVKEVTEKPPAITGVGIEETTTYDRVIEDDGRIAVRRIKRIFDDGKEVSKKFHRSWIMPGDDIETHPEADEVSKAIATKLHTADVITAYEAKIREMAIVELTKEGKIGDVK